MSDDEYGYDDDYDNGGDDAEIEIENIYMEAEDKKHSNPKDALEGYQSVIMMEESRSEKKFTFKALLETILIKCRIGQLNGLSDDVSQILKNMDKVSKNDANDGINNMLEAMIDLKEQDKAQSSIEKILDYLKAKGFEQLWLNASIKLCKIYSDRKNLTAFQTLIEGIKTNCRFPDGQDDPKKSSVLLEVYSMEINLHMQTMNIPKIKEIYNRTKNIQSAIADPRTMGIIKDTHGKMLMIEKDWETARLELFEAFKFYQEVGSNRAKQVLKYVVIVSILANSGLNPFDNVEAKVYRDDPDISLMDSFRTAYERRNGKELIRIYSSGKSKIFDDSFIQQFQEDLMTVICLEMVITLVVPFKKIKFDYLSKEINLNAKQVSSLLSRLVLDGRLHGRIDLIDNYFENFECDKDVVEEKKKEALNQFVRSLKSIGSS